MRRNIFLLQHADMIENMEATFYVIEMFPTPQFVMSDVGDTRTFDNYPEALK